MMSPKVEQEFIQVAVPAQHVMSVYRLLSELEQEPDADAGLAGTSDALGRGTPTSWPGWPAPN